jgi:TonB family protein
MKKIFFLLALILWGCDVKSQATDEKVYQEFEVAKNAEYPDGINAFRKELMQNINYPYIAKKNKTQGSVILMFTIDEQGSIISVKILKDIGDSCGDASVEALKKITTKWQPAMKDGKPVKVRKSIPVMFKLDGYDSPKKERDTIIAPEYTGKVEIKPLASNDLYEGCGNHILIIGATNPQFSIAKNGSYVSVKDNKNKIIAIPYDDSKTITIWVYENDKLIGKKIFNVKKVPAALAQVFVDGKEINTSKGINLKNLEKIELRAMADKDFAKIFPDEIKYKIGNLDATTYTLKRGNSVILTSKNITEISQQAKKGDVLEIQIIDVRRTNFRGSVSPAKVSNPVINIPIL